VKAAGGVRSLEELIKMKELGVTRIGATATAVIVEEARKRNGLTSAEVSSTDKSGY
jgi:deoxyribose-phosphate aldolase